MTAQANKLPPRRTSRVVSVGPVKIGGGHPISIQSMTNTVTADTAATLRQIYALAEAGCQIARVAVPDEQTTETLPALIAASPLPVVADIHFDHKLALGAVKSGAHGLRINPGNIGAPARLREVARAAKDAGIPIRVGVNGGSLEKALLQKYGGPTAEALVESALQQAELLEKEGFSDIKISLKTSDVLQTLAAYRMLAKLCDYPLHIGLTEAGPPGRGGLKSAVALGILLYQGIGDTMRVSLTGDPLEEVRAAKEILNALHISLLPFDVISCPTCGRTGIDVAALTARVESALAGLKPLKLLKIAVMGCAVNGPGEAREADFGIAGARGEGLLFAKGEIIGKYAEEDLVEKLVEEIRRAL